VNALFYQKIERVIFLDEAYAITTYDQKGQLDSFSDEAITALLTLLDDNPGKSCLLVAGYEQEMQDDFLASNEGLKRRFGYFFHIEDYSPEKLYDIFTDRLTEESGFLPSLFTSAAKNYLIEFIRKTRELYEESEVNSLARSVDDDAVSVSGASTTSSTAPTEPVDKKDNRWQPLYDFLKTQAASMVTLAQEMNKAIQAHAPGMTNDLRFGRIGIKAIFGLLATVVTMRKPKKKNKIEAIQLLKEVTQIVGAVQLDAQGRALAVDRLDGDWSWWQDQVDWIEDDNAELRAEGEGVGSSSNARPRANPGRGAKRK
jgi:hypothetical protein